MSRQSPVLGSAVVGFALGVIALQVQPALPLWAAVGFCGIVSFFLPLAPGARRLAIVLGCFALGFAWAGWRAELRLSDALAEHWEGRDVTVVGVIAGMPQPFSRGERFAFDVESVATPGAQIPGHILISWYRGSGDEATEAAQALTAGERWRLTLRLKRPHGNANPEGFDYEAWLLEYGLRATGYVRRSEENVLFDPFVAGLGYGIERLRQSIRDRFLRVLPVESHPYGGVLAALAVGDQRAIQGDLWSVFNRTGTTHLMSISGLHVTLVATLFGWGVGALWRRVPALAMRIAAQRAAIVAGLLAALVYSALAGFGVPAQRTLYMLATASIAIATGRRVTPGRVLALALLTVLLVDP